MNNPFLSNVSSLLGAVALLCPLAGCVDESISDGNSAYYGGNQRYEIDELSLLGAAKVTEDDIHGALRGSGRVFARPGSTLLVVQSGAMAPDSIMLAAVEQHYQVFPFAGVSPTGPTLPPNGTAPWRVSYASLRRRAGARTFSATGESWKPSRRTR